MADYNSSYTGAQIDSAVGKSLAMSALTGVLTGDGSSVSAKTLDTSTLTNDNNHIPTSGAVKSAIDAVDKGWTLLGNSTTLESGISISAEELQTYKFFIVKVNAFDDGVETFRGNQLLVPSAEIVSYGSYAFSVQVGTTDGNSVFLYTIWNNTGLTYWYADYVGQTVPMTNLSWICRLYGLK